MFKKILSSMPLSRWIVYLSIASLLPSALFISDFYSKHCFNKEIGASIESATQSALMKSQKQSVNQLIRKEYANTDPLYLDRHLESLSLLGKEKIALERLIHGSHFTGNEKIEGRYHFLTSDNNRLKFVPGSQRSGEGFQESLESLARPVEVDGADIQKILSLIEGKIPQQPQLIITDFKLMKKQGNETGEVFDLQMKVLKREFLS